MEMATVAEVVLMKAERPMIGGSQQEEDELRSRKMSVGGPMLLWRAPRNMGHMTGLRSAYFIYRPHWKQEASL